MSRSVKMKVKILSDLHLEHLDSEYTFDVGSGEVLVLAGDILVAKHLNTDGNLNRIYNSFLNFCSENFKHVFYVFGNHEFYGYNYESTFKKVENILPSNIHLMNNNTVEIEDWVFIGGTLWTDHNKGNPVNMMENQYVMNDYHRIRIGSNYRKLNTEDTLSIHRNTKSYFENQLNIHKDKKVFMISHMAPSYQSTHPHYKGQSLNSAYCNDMDDWISSRPQIKYFVHGHVHYFMDYTIDGCRVICNPKGYPRETTNYNPNLEIEI